MDRNISCNRSIRLATCSNNTEKCHVTIVSIENTSLRVSSFGTVSHYSYSINAAIPVHKAVKIDVRLTSKYCIFSISVVRSREAHSSCPILPFPRSLLLLWHPYFTFALYLHEPHASYPLFISYSPMFCNHTIASWYQYIASVPNSHDLYVSLLSPYAYLSPSSVIVNSSTPELCSSLRSRALSRAHLVAAVLSAANRTILQRPAVWRATFTSVRLIWRLISTHSNYVVPMTLSGGTKWKLTIGKAIEPLAIYPEIYIWILGHRASFKYFTRQASHGISVQIWSSPLRGDIKN